MTDPNNAPDIDETSTESEQQEAVENVESPQDEQNLKDE